MSDVLSNIRWKIRRAIHHAQAADDSAKEFFKSDFYRLVLEDDRKGRSVFRVAEAQPMPPHFAIFIGEAAHQLRSCLDHLIVALARPLPREEKYVQFPLVDSRKKFRGTRGNMPGVPRGVRTLVESLQPYHRRKWPQTALLGQLKAIDDWDKHRMLMTAAAHAEFVSVDFLKNTNSTIRNIETFSGILKPGAIVARLEIEQTVPGAEVQMQPALDVFPAFDHRMPKEIRGRPAVRTISNAGRFIRDEVIPMFEKFF